VCGEYSSRTWFCLALNWAYDQELMLIQRMLGQTPHLTRQMQERMAAAAART